MFEDLKYNIKFLYTKNEKLIVHSCGRILVFAFLIVSAFSLTQGKNSSLNIWIGSPKGAVLLTLLGGFFFYYINFYYDEKAKEREQERQDAINNYNWMMEFLNNGDSYEFSTPDYKDEEGSPFLYTFVPAKVNGKIVYFNNSISNQYILTVKDVSYRSTCSEGRIKDYISGPLKVGNSYYIRFYGDKWKMETNLDGVTILPNSKMAKGYYTPSPQKLVVDDNFNEYLKKLSLVESIVFNDFGDFTETGQMARVYFEESTKKTFVQIGEYGILREFFVTYGKNDYSKNDPFIVIEKIEGFFKSSIHLLNFKNNLNNLCQGKGITIKELEFWQSLNFKGQ